MNETYDVAVIGMGSGGLNVGMAMHKLGFKVLMIDKSDSSIGGDCLNFGCVPSKALIHISRLASDAKLATKFGLRTSGKIDLKKAMQYVKEKQDVIREHEKASYFRSLGISVVLGEAQLHSPNQIRVSDSVYTAKKIILATGSRPKVPNIPGLDKVKYQTNETIFNLQKLPQKLPQKLLVIGGGPIGIELAQAFSRLGSKVEIVENRSSFLPKENPKISKILQNQLEKEGIKIHFNTSCERFTSSGSAILKNKSGQKTSINFDQVLISIGRELNIPKGLEKANVSLDSSGKIITSNKLQTTNPNILVCGDLLGSYQFTHAAELHAAVILNNFFSPIKKKLSLDFMSWVTYTDPEIATFGLNEKTLQERGIKFETIIHDFKEDDRAIVNETTQGKLILYISKGKILGGSMVAKNAGEIFQELSLAMSSKLDIKHLFNKTYPYPTASRVNKRAIMNKFSEKLTPKTKKILGLMFKILN